jgi:hypothetical protein
MGIFRTKFVARRPVNTARRAFAGLCDVCDAELNRADAYCLPTRSIVISQAFWRHQFALIEGMTAEAKLDDERRANLFSKCVVEGAKSETPWHVCEDCGQFFIFDRNEARSCAVNATEPKGNGPVEPAQCVLFAAIGWEQVFGEWPSIVEQPGVVVPCGLCARKVYEGEYAGSMDTAEMEHLRDSGVIDGEPQSPPRPGVGTWLVCVSCAAKIEARQQRA